MWDDDLSGCDSKVLRTFFRIAGVWDVSGGFLFGRGARARERERPQEPPVDPLVGAIWGLKAWCQLEYSTYR